MLIMLTRIKHDLHYLSNADGWKSQLQTVTSCLGLTTLVNPSEKGCQSK